MPDMNNKNKKRKIAIEIVLQLILIAVELCDQLRPALKEKADMLNIFVMSVQVVCLYKTRPIKLSFREAKKIAKRDKPKKQKRPTRKKWLNKKKADTKEPEP